MKPSRKWLFAEMKLKKGTLRRLARVGDFQVYATFVVRVARLQECREVLSRTEESDLMGKFGRRWLWAVVTSTTKRKAFFE